jgi:hypothetical protein
LLQGKGARQKELCRPQLPEVKDRGKQLLPQMVRQIFLQSGAMLRRKILRRKGLGELPLMKCALLLLCLQPLLTAMMI